MLKVFTGRVWEFGDNISTDSIAPGRLTHLRSKPAEYAKHVFEDTNPEFPKKVKQGDIIVAGENFGCGSSREIAPLIIKLAGIGVICAKSFARIFYRNALNIGLPAIECDTDKFEDGEIVSVDLNEEIIKKGDGSKFIMKISLDDIAKRLLEEDGLLSYVDRHGTLPVT